ncbi:hypothetical protein [Candidatus Contendibacter odensensis]|uniref:hypothetical protein n=1 Tax=Candidatus Contendibacter odensensis TaxID=1400860 RepID=UPI0012B685A3|nr:hypothetical protein [Candidatus Contendobacter odensis]
MSEGNELGAPGGAPNTPPLMRREDFVAGRHHNPFRKAIACNRMPASDDGLGEPMTSATVSTP